MCSSDLGNSVCDSGIRVTSVRGSECRKHPRPFSRSEDDWCGEHPDFDRYVESLALAKSIAADVARDPWYWIVSLSPGESLRLSNLVSEYDRTGSLEIAGKVMCELERLSVVRGVKCPFKSIHELKRCRDAGWSSWGRP